MACGKIKPRAIFVVQASALLKPKLTVIGQQAPSEPVFLSFGYIKSNGEFVVYHNKTVGRLTKRVFVIGNKSVNFVY